MKRQIGLWVTLLVFWLALTILPGCGESKAKITGKLLKNGQPLVVKNDTLVTLTFFPDTENPGQTYPAKFFHETGGYELEIPTGKYRVSYVIVEKDKAPVMAPAEVKKKSYELSKNQELDIEIMAR